MRWLLSYEERKNLEMGEKIQKLSEIDKKFGEEFYELLHKTLTLIPTENIETVMPKVEIEKPKRVRRSRKQIEDSQIKPKEGEKSDTDKQ